MNRFDLTNPILRDFIAHSLFIKIKNNEKVDEQLRNLLYNNLIIDTIRNKYITAEDKGWIEERILKNFNDDNFYIKYVINFYQLFVSDNVKKELFRLLEQSNSIALVFLLTKLNLSEHELNQLFDLVLANWDSFREEESYYENPFMNFNNAFIEKFEKRLNNSDRENYNRFWLYILSSMAVIGKNFKKSHIDTLKHKIQTLVVDNELVTSFYETKIINKLKEYEH